MVVKSNACSAATWMHSLHMPRSSGSIAETGYEPFIILFILNFNLTISGTRFYAALFDRDDLIFNLILFCIFFQHLDEFERTKTVASSNLIYYNRFASISTEL